MIKKEKLTVIIAKSDKLLCDLLCGYVNEKGLTVIGQACTGLDAFKLLIEKSPKIIIVGAELSGGLQGVDIATYICENSLSTKLILFSKDKSQAILAKAERNNVSGILFFDDGQAELSDCIDSILEGNIYRSPQVEKVLSQSMNTCEYQKEIGSILYSKLTPVELKVLWLVSQHLSVRQIGEELFISHHTVSNHQSNIREKLAIKGHGSLLQYALSIKDRLVEANGQVWIRPE